MARRIAVTTEMLLSTSEKIESIIADYQRIYMKLYSEIDSMNAAWDGADNAAYVSQVKGFEDDLQLMYRLMLEYAQFVRMSAKTYQNTQDELISAARSLPTGGQSCIIMAKPIDKEKFKPLGPGGVPKPSFKGIGGNFSGGGS